ncbi:SPOR domain-containing protein [Pseudomonas sp. JS3066]|jgi:cell division septation protein DedD|uniref:SPOR domain-containing protein n=1 Tax=unclassified Pseudomonas TaxID=196821 RepID=UPI000EAA45B6|nr:MULTISPECIES: SPOR domain-containing protein [unclassified Pseudomonas]AYF88764.1 SPOR domain-containing protein [Pseudomonas sp. DY-1]MDH4651814.1 SPOR domain-containing protein [Pseudomonas sp. BN606]MRK20580.1 SPOR domain-containing protein [Pseudomonas sp. JG-B]WVK93695.1 SPOR domain-containing protein [Pseudomonas sp. JS3066]
MRWLFLFLLVLNLFYYVWHQQQAPLRPKEVETLSLYKGGQQDIRLLSESGNVQPRRTAVVPTSTEEAVCLFLGGFEREEQAREVEQRLISLDVRSEVRPVDAAAGTDYWVYLAPLASREASLRQLKELQARKIDSYIVTQGDLINGISLGIFSRMDSAESVMQRLRDAGYEPFMRELARAHRDYWVRIAPESRRLVDDPLLEQLSQDFFGLKHQLMPCEGVASPR